MKTIITEEMRFRQRVVEYAIKYDNNEKAARRVITALFREIFQRLCHICLTSL